jgi:hypothetical protein
MTIGDKFYCISEKYNKGCFYVLITYSRITGLPILRNVDVVDNGIKELSIQNDVFTIELSEIKEHFITYEQYIRMEKIKKISSIIN